MKRGTALWVGTALLIIGFASSCADRAPSAPASDGKDFISLFDGKSLTGWRKLKEYSGEDGLWEVLDGAIVGDQFPEGRGGLLVYDRLFQDFEVMAEVKADYPIDSGLFLRVQPDVLSYQITIDYRPEGEVGALYCPGGGDFLVHNPQGQELWKADEYNTVRARIEGQPPKIQAWINGVMVLDYADSKTEDGFRVPERGFFGIQVHPGASWGKGNKVYFRTVKIKELQ